MIHDKKEIIYFYIDIQIRKQYLKKVLIKFNIIEKLINQKMFYNIDLFIY